LTTTTASTTKMIETTIATTTKAVQLMKMHGKGRQKEMLNFPEDGDEDASRDRKKCWTCLNMD